MVDRTVKTRHYFGGREIFIIHNLIGINNNKDISNYKKGTTELKKGINKSPVGHKTSPTPLVE